MPPSSTITCPSFSSVSTVVLLVESAISILSTLSPPMPMMTATMMMMTYRPFLMTDDEIGRRLALLDGDDDDREETAMERLRGGDVGEEEDDLFLK